ncbi:unnamed protein product [Clonostachys rhizophaga]|uniref:Uncharacterized protein n=1 Tax=Clonostachys rhizophaga TaxID=160324 RepID=A0A9N9V1G5_9HYPO|nr:unnamed protein product [Clonostachys rhizophaga]
MTIVSKDADGGLEILYGATNGAIEQIDRIDQDRFVVSDVCDCELELLESEMWLLASMSTRDEMDEELKS